MAATLEKEEEGKEEGKEAGSEGSSHGEKEDKATEEESQTPKAPRRPKTMQIKVTLLDDTLYECELEVRNNVVIFCLICETILWVVVVVFFFACVCARACVRNMSRARSCSPKYATTSICWRGTIMGCSSGRRPKPR